MRALELVEYNHFKLIEVPVPEISENEVLIRVNACGICGSDVHGMDGSTGRRIPPIIMGHEASGEVVRVGASVANCASGDHVTFDSTIYCGTCAFCKKGEINLCDNRQVLGVSCAEYRRQGAFAEYVAVPSRGVHLLPEGLGYEWAAMVEPVSVAVHAVNRVQVSQNDRVVVIGVGMIGALVVQVLKAKGVKEVIAVDIDPAKLKFAKSLGADSVSDSSVGQDVDVAIEVVGISKTVEMAVQSVRKGGRVGLVGNLSPLVQIPLQLLVTREISLFGSCASQGDYPESLALIASGAVQVAPMISAKITLQEAPEYFERLHRGEPGLGKVIVCP